MPKKKISIHFFLALEAIGLTQQLKRILAKNHPLRQEEAVWLTCKTTSSSVTV